MRPPGRGVANTYPDMVSGEIHLICCCTTEMVADTLTKALPSQKVKHFTAELGIRRA